MLRLRQLWYGLEKTQAESPKLTFPATSQATSLASAPTLPPLLELMA